MEEKLDVILLTHNHLEQTIECVDALYNFVHVPFKLTVIDDSTDLTPQFFKMFQAGHPDINYVRPTEIIKCGNQAINIGMKHTTSEVVLFITQSTTVTRSFLVTGLSIISNHEEVGCVGFKILYSHGTIMEAGAVVDCKTASRGNVGMHEPGWDFTHCRDIDAVGWAAVLLRREAIGVLDEETYIGFRGWDDVDNCLTLWENGFKVVYCGFGVVIHKLGASQGGNTPEGVLECQQNGVIFETKWRGRKTRVPEVKIFVQEKGSPKGGLHGEGVPIEKVGK